MNVTIILYLTILLHYACIMQLDSILFLMYFFCTENINKRRIYTKQFLVYSWRECAVYTTVLWAIKFYDYLAHFTTCRRPFQFNTYINFFIVPGGIQFCLQTTPSLADSPTHIGDTQKHIYRTIDDTTITFLPQFGLHKLKHNTHRNSKEIHWHLRV